MKKYFALLGLCFLLPITFINARAETCPSVSMLNSHSNLGQWQPLDADNGTPLTEQRLQDFENDVQAFWQAAYYTDAPEGAAQCYYWGGVDKPYLNVYLAQPNLKPAPRATEWKKQDANSLVCLETPENCLFS